MDTEKLCMGCMNDIDGEQICPICGYDNSLQNHSQALPVKFIIKNRYIIGKALSVNGEGITYIGWDLRNNNSVKIKEYFPLGIAFRNPDATVSILPDKKYVFNEGLLEFIEIGRVIMGKSLSALQEVEDVFEASGTAYTVYHNIQGITLSDFLNRNGGVLKWEQARALLLPLIDTVKAMNDIGIYHNAISPETIIVGRDGKLRLTDYSIKRLRISDSDVESELYDGYAAIEQYGVANMKAGTYTDVYGLCATLFRIFIGSDIPKATLRMENPGLAIPTKFAEELPRHVLAAMANGLKVNPNERTANIEALKNELVYGEIVEADPEVKAEVKSSSKEEKSKEKKTSGVKYAVASAGITAVVFLLVGAVLYFSLFKGNKENNTPTESNVVVSVPEEEDTTSKYEDLPEKTYTVPDFTGKTYAEILEDENNENFVFVIKDSKVYSSDFARGQICKQSVKKGKEVKKETKIELTISLGSKEFKMPNVVGLDEQSAKLELLKAGFLYENIRVLEKYDENSEPGKILEQTPEHSEKVNADIVVSIYKNTYEGEDPVQGGDDQAILDEYTSEVGQQN
ncbi:MAG: PASTA domain-containing protein [Clostridia bacterium]|nr:PASTA domain-containing protein [Clostridia bacterium]